MFRPCWGVGHQLVQAALSRTFRKLTMQNTEPAGNMTWNNSAYESLPC